MADENPTPCRHEEDARDAARYRALFTITDFCRDPLWPVLYWMRDGREVSKAEVDEALDAACGVTAGPRTNVGIEGLSTLADLDAEAERIAAVAYSSDYDAEPAIKALVRRALAAKTVP